jgi:uncharacterized DUF497 family protein
MKHHYWNASKNELLQRTRGISFEDILFHIEQGCVIEIIKHPNVEKYRDQQLYIININNYVYLVPFVETQNEVFLITIIPSRKATKLYLGGKSS